MCCFVRVQHWSIQPFFLITKFVFDDANRTSWKKNSSWKDSHRAQIAYLFKTEAPIQYCNKSWLQFWVKNPTVLAKQFMLRPDVTWNQSELFHFCMLTYIIGKKSKTYKTEIYFIRWRFKSRVTNIRLSLSFLQCKEQNEYHLSYCNEHYEFIFFT